MYLSTSENFIIDVLDCGTSDISMLDEVYSSLAENVTCTADIIRDLIRYDNLNLNSLLYEVYHEVADSIMDKANELLDRDELDITQEKKDEIKGYISSMNNEPFINFQDTHFQNEIDQTISWEDNVYTNAISLIDYLVELLEEEKVEVE